jgi:hypothetical protein
VVAATNLATLIVGVDRRVKRWDASSRLAGCILADGVGDLAAAPWRRSMPRSAFRPNRSISATVRTELRDAAGQVDLQALRDAMRCHREEDLVNRGLAAWRALDHFHPIVSGQRGVTPGWPSTAPSMPHILTM